MISREEKLGKQCAVIRPRRTMRPRSNFPFPLHRLHDRRRVLEAPPSRDLPAAQREDHAPGILDRDAGGAGGDPLAANDDDLLILRDELLRLELIVGEEFLDLREERLDLLLPAALAGVAQAW